MRKVYITVVDEDNKTVTNEVWTSEADEVLILGVAATSSTLKDLTEAIRQDAEDWKGLFGTDDIVVLS
jgi:hypothetical protein